MRFGVAFSQQALKTALQIVQAMYTPIMFLLNFILSRGRRIMTFQRLGVAMPIEEKKLEFVYKAIEDSQQTIRFVDTKTSVTTFVIGLLIALLTGGLPDFSNYFWHMPPVLQATTIVLIVVATISTTLTIYIAIQVVYPKSNPAQHVVKTTNLRGAFYVYEMHEVNGKMMVKQTYEDYLRSLDSIADIEDVTKELAFELLKVSYIREHKIRLVQKMKRRLYVVLAALPFLIAIHFIGLSHYKKDAVTPTVTVQYRR